MKIKSSLECDDFGFGSYLIPLNDVFKREVKVSFCPIEGLIYYF